MGASGFGGVLVCGALGVLVLGTSGWPVRASDAGQASGTGPGLLVPATSAEARREAY